MLTWFKKWANVLVHYFATPTTDWAINQTFTIRWTGHRHDIYAEVFWGQLGKSWFTKQKKLALSGSFCLLHFMASDRGQIIVKIAQKYVQAFRTEQRSNLQPQASSGLRATYLQLLIIHPATLPLTFYPCLLTLISAKQRLLVDADDNPYLQEISLVDDGVGDLGVLVVGTLNGLLGLQGGQLLQTHPQNSSRL